MRRVYVLVLVVAIMIMMCGVPAGSPSTRSSHPTVLPVPSDDIKNHYDLTIGPCDYEYITWDRFEGDGVYGDFAVTSPSGKAIQFFVADSETYNFWKSGNPVLADVSITDTSGSFKYRIPHSGYWYFVFSNPIDFLNSRRVSSNLCLDQTPPDISMNLAAGATYSGTKEITATISEATFDIKSVTLHIDTVQKSVKTSSSFSYSWDTTKYGNGTHTIRLTADDTVGNERYEEVVVNVTNVVTTTSTSTTTTTTTSSQAGSPIVSPVSLAVGLVAVVTVVAGSVYCKHAGLRTKTGTTQMIANES